MPQVVIVQRYYYSFREGFFDCLKSSGLDFKLINSTKSRGRVKVHLDKVRDVNYIINCKNFNINDGLVVFPFLFFKLWIFRPSIVVTEGGQNTINNLQVYLYCKLFGKKYIQWDLGRGYKDFGHSILRRLYMNMYTFITRNSALIYGYNSSSRKYFLDLGTPSTKIIVLNNTVDTVSLRRVINESNERMPDDLKKIYDPNKKYLIFVGTLLPSKNIESFDDIMRLLGDDYHLFIVGEGEKCYVDYLKDLFREINCTFLGYKKPEELLPYYRVSLFSILPGLGGLSINQAMAYGVPVLCTKADGAEKDIVRDNETGYIYNDVKELVKFINTRSKEDWEFMGANASNLLYTDFSIERECERFITNIKTLL